MDNKKLEELEARVNRLEQENKEQKKEIQQLKDILWDKESKKESSKMYQVLEKNKPYTTVTSNVGTITVDKDFMEKKTRKHLDNPALRGMIYKQELLSFPKVAKNVGAEIDENKSSTWYVKANDGNTITYGSRAYEQNGKEINRLLTAHSKTESGQRNTATAVNIIVNTQSTNNTTAEVDGRSHPHHSIFKDFNFRKSAAPTIPQQSQNVNNNPQQDKPPTKEEFMQQEQEKMASAKNSKEVEVYSASKDKDKEASKDREKPKDEDLEI